MELICISATFHKRDDKNYKKFDVIPLAEPRQKGNYSEKNFRELPDGFVMPSVDTKYLKFDENFRPVEMNDDEKQKIDAVEKEQLKTAKKQERDKEALTFGQKLVHDFKTQTSDNPSISEETEGLLLERLAIVMLGLNAGDLKAGHNVLKNVAVDEIFTAEKRQELVDIIQEFRDYLDKKYA